MCQLLRGNSRHTQGFFLTAFFYEQLKWPVGKKKETKLLKFPYYTQCEISIFFNPQQKKVFFIICVFYSSVLDTCLKEITITLLAGSVVAALGGASAAYMTSQRAN